MKHNKLPAKQYEILLAPLQGITDYYFRNAFNVHFLGLDKAYSPFIRLKGGKIKTSQIKDVLPENNNGLNLIPQILTNSVDEFIFLANYLADFGYPEINWNLGCPFPMVAKRQMGSGMLPYPERIEQLLEKVMPIIPVKLSIKMRLGYESEHEISNILPLLDKFPISEIIIHTRIGKQMYKGQANPAAFESCMKLTKHKLAYNGDVDSLATFEELDTRFKTVNSWMIGRAAISNPFLIEEIKTGEYLTANKKMERFSEFHTDLYEQYSGTLSGSGHILNKMLHFWEYFSQSFTNSRKVYKAIKKSNSINKFEESIHRIFNNEQWRPLNE